MIVYKNTLNGFIEDCYPKGNTVRNIADIVKEKMTLCGLGGTNDNQVQSWRASLPEVAKVLEDSLFDRAIEVAIEYKPSISRERIDFLVCGTDEFGNKNVVVIELKQWSQASRSNLKDFVWTFGGHGLDDYWHPSYQAYNYTEIIKNFNEYVQTADVGFHACSYLHNMPEELRGLLDNEDTYPLVKTSPAFLQNDILKLREFVGKYVTKPFKDPLTGFSLLYTIDNSKMVPAPKLVSTLAEALKGNDFFSYDEGQANAVATIVNQVRAAKEKTVIIIKGGPGSGKSVVAINALGKLVSGELAFNKKQKQKPLTCAYVTANSAPKVSYSQELIQNNFKYATLKELFKGPASFKESRTNDFDCLLVDEAHRVFEYDGGSFGLPKTGLNALELLIRAAKVCVFFIDEDQQVTTHDFATIDVIKKTVKKMMNHYNTPINIIENQKLNLTSEFRCLGGEDYIAFINGFLGYKENTIGKYKKTNSYDFRVFDSAEEMMEEIEKRDKEEKEKLSKNHIFDDISGRCRLVAGYTYEWVSKDFDRSDNIYDIKLDLDSPKPFRAKWNLRNQRVGARYSWLDDPCSTKEVGCIHTCQGLDLQYCGVIIGKDLTYNEAAQQIQFHKDANAKSDKNSGIGFSTTSDALAEKLIRNTYKVLLTRGMKGTYVYCEDKALAKYLKSLIID